MRIGYARVSTDEQELGGQVARLQAAGCQVIYQEKISTRLKDRPELARMLEGLKSGDVVTVCKLDRLGRSLRDLIDLVAGFKRDNVEFVSLGDAIDTTTAAGNFMFNILASVAEFERELISERTRAGLKYKRSQGVVLGRPVLDRSDDGKELIRLLSEGLDVEGICKVKGWSRARYFRVKKAIKAVTK